MGYNHPHWGDKKKSKVEDDSLQGSKEQPKQLRLRKSPPGMVHAWVGQIVLKCNDFKTLLSKWPFLELEAAITLCFGREACVFRGLMT